MATNGGCVHARELRQWARLEGSSKALADHVTRICRDRAALAESLRRWQAGTQIESDFIDPFDPEAYGEVKGSKS